MEAISIRLDERSLPVILDSLRQCGCGNSANAKDTLTDAERDEYLALVSFWKSRTLEKAEADVALQRLKEAVPDLVIAP